MSRGRSHAVRVLTLVVALYIVARFFGWTGPRSTIDWRPELMYPAIAVITLWGLARLARFATK